MELKELTNRKYEGSDCIGFAYSVKEETSDTEIEFKFTRKIKSRLWQMEVNLPRTINADMQCYVFPYEMRQYAAYFDLCYRSCIFSDVS